jgi:putative acetyltransferase
LSLVIVRRATIEDAAAMAQVIAEVAPEGFLGTEPPVDVEERTQRFRGMMEGDRPGALWVLEDGGRVVGSGAAQERVRGVLTLGMAILPQARGRGGGRALVQAAIDHARACGAHKLDLEVWTDNARAISLYATAGFQVEGLRRDHYLRRDGRLRSTLLMGLVLRGNE